MNRYHDPIEADMKLSYLLKIETSSQQGCGIFTHQKLRVITQSRKVKIMEMTEIDIHRH